MIPKDPTEVLRERLTNLARWCERRAAGNHNLDTTTTILQNKAREIRDAVVCARRRAACWRELGGEPKPGVLETGRDVTALMAPELERICEQAAKENTPPRRVRLWPR